jgi:hypothetical protein
MTIVEVREITESGWFNSLSEETQAQIMRALMAGYAPTADPDDRWTSVLRGRDR